MHLLCSAAGLLVVTDLDNIYTVDRLVIYIVDRLVSQYLCIIYKTSTPSDIVD